MPAGLALRTAAMGAAYGLFPIGWIILNVIFLYDLTVETGSFKVMQDSLTGITRDRRLQLLLIAFSFGAFFEGAAGFGTPVAVTAAILIGLGFPPRSPPRGCPSSPTPRPSPSAPWERPIIALAGVTGLDVRDLSAMVGRQLPFFSILIPFWLVWAYLRLPQDARGLARPARRRACRSPVPQFLISNFHGPWLVGLASSVVSIAALVRSFLKFWRPRSVHRLTGESEDEPGPRARRRSVYSPESSPGPGCPGSS